MICFDDAITSNTLIPKSFMAFLVNRFANYEGYYRGRPTVQTNKPVQEPKLGSSLGAFQLANPNENPNFNQVVPVFVQMMAGKPYKHYIVSVPLKNIDIDYGLMLRDFGELETRKWPPWTWGAGGVCA